MASQYPDALDTTISLPNRSSGDLIPATDNNDKNAALIALEKKVGIGVSDAASAATGQVPKKQANGTTAWSSLTKADVGLSNVPNTDATNRANHTGSQSSSTISDFQEAVQDAVAALLAAGTSISLAYDDAANTLTITGTGGGGGLDAEAVRDAIGIALIGSGLISVTVNDAADTITISTTATQNDTDANLKNRANHTGTQDVSSITGLGSLATKNSITVADLGAGVLDADLSSVAGTDTTIPSAKAVKDYVDAVASGLDLKASVRAATTTAGTLASSFANGQVIDGVTLVTGNRILIKDQSTGSENGIYTVNASGAPTRAADADSSAEVTPGMFVYVEEGTANADKGFALTTNNPITLGSTALVFTPFSSGGSGTPGGSTTQLQFNNAGSFAGSSYLTTDESTKALGVAGKVNSGDFLIGNLNLTPNVVYVGDSLTYGITEASHPYNYYIHLPTWNGQTIVETNIGLGGLRITNYQERAALYQNPLFSRRAALNIAVVWGSHNDFANGVSAVQTYNALVAFCRHLRSLGWRVLVMTAISSDNGIGNFDGQKNTYNGLIRPSWQDFADMLVDVAANPLLGADGAHSNGTYFHDGVHLTDTGYALVASIVEPALISYLEQATTIAAHKEGVVIHGEDADAPRPIGYLSVKWLGSVSPNNATDYDTWIGPATI